MTVTLSRMDDPGRLLTIDDLEAIPYDGKRYELIDGVLHVSPAAAPKHQSLAALLTVWLMHTAPRGLTATQAIDMHVSRLRSFIPDVLVVTTKSLIPNKAVAPADVLLAVEVVSPGSKGMDRVRKPRYYAEAGVPSFWRIELEPIITVHTYELDESTSVYRFTGAFDDVVKVGTPWPIELPIAEIDPSTFG